MPRSFGVATKFWSFWAVRLGRGPTLSEVSSSIVGGSFGVDTKFGSFCAVKSVNINN